MDIQRLEAGEVERFRAVRLRALRDAPGAFGTRYEDAVGRPSERWATLFGSVEAFVAVGPDGNDVGLVWAGPDRDEPGTAWLGAMWVTPAARGRGVGDALIDAVVEWARSEGFEEVVLTVGDDNPAAIVAYERKGFRPTGETGSLPPPREDRTTHYRRLAL